MKYTKNNLHISLIYNLKYFSNLCIQKYFNFHNYIRLLNFIEKNQYINNSKKF